MSIVAACGYGKLPKLASDDAQNPDALVEGPPQFTSCMGLPMTCGRSGNANCCDAALVEGGTYYRSYDGAGNNNMSFPATVSSFILDTYEVTVGRFRAFVDAGLGTLASPPVAGTGAHPKLEDSGWDSGWNTSLPPNTSALVTALNCSSTYQTWTDTRGMNENKPINCVTWYEAMAFCIWDGGYLPTEAEWNYAASGGDEQRAYPWSSNPFTSTNIDCTYTNYFINNPPGTYCVIPATGGVNRVGTEAPKGDAKWTHSDLAGNVWEWTLDRHEAVYISPCIDCANLNTSASSDRVFRGGGFTSDALYLRVAGRSFVAPSNRNYNLGLRCARRAP